jgi:hypothetical protein
MDNKNQKVLKTLAVSHPDFDGYLEEAAQAIDLKADLPPELTEDIIKALQADPEMSAAIEALYEAPEQKREFVATSVLAGAGVLIAAVFLLRTHIKIKRHPDGRWEFVFEHKPGDNELLTQVIEALKKILPGGE